MMINAYKLAKIACLLLMVIGYAAVYYRRQKNLRFFPMTLVAGITVTLYVFGLFGQLKIGSYALLAAGVMLSVLFCRKKELRAFFSEPAILFVALGAVWLYAVTRGVTLSAWDDGSHWYRICKSLSYEGAYPTTPDILYYDYVPGTATWIYFVTRFVDFSIEQCLWAQGLINLACISTLFAGMKAMEHKWEKAICTATVTAAGVAMCAMGTNIFGLRADVVLGLTAMAAMLFVLDEDGTPDVQIALALTFLALIKNSAIFFAAAAALTGYMYPRGRRSIRRTAAWIAPALLALCVYLIRAAVVFESKGGLQGVPVARYSNQAMQKDWGMVGYLSLVYLKNILFTGSGISAVYMVALLLVLVYAGFRIEKEEDCAVRIRQCMLILGVILAAYLVMLYCTYMFAMRPFEAAGVAGFERYYGSFAIMAAGVAIYTCMTQSARAKRSRYFFLCILLFAALALPATQTKKYVLGYDYFDTDGKGKTLWSNMQFLVPQNNQYRSDKYVVVYDEHDYWAEGRVRFAIGAWVRSDNVYVIPGVTVKNGMQDEQIQAVREADYLVVLDDVSAIEPQLSQALGPIDLSLGTHAME